MLAVINQLAKLDSNLSVEFVCDAAFESQARGLMEQADIAVKVSVITAGKFRRYKHLSFWQHFTVPSVVFGNSRDSIKIIKGLFQSIGILIRRRPDVVFAKGGYVSLPMGIAAWLLNIPIVIHDSDTRPGLTNRVLSRFATIIATGSPLENYSYPADRSYYVGVPISPDFKPVDTLTQRKLKRELGFDESAFLIVGTGGGLGSTSINNALLKLAPVLAKDNVIIYDITGKSHYDTIRDASKGIRNFYATAFVFDGMSQVLGAADLVVARGSATFIQELAGIGKPVVMVPARQLGDQLKNAEMYEKAKAAVVISEASPLDESDDFLTTISQLQQNKKARDELAKNLHTFARPHAAHEVAKLIVKALE